MRYRYISEIRNCMVGFAVVDFSIAFEIFIPYFIALDKGKHK